jgi:WD40 repeat protein
MKMYPSGIDYRAIIGGILLLMLLCVSGCGQPQSLERIAFVFEEEDSPPALYVMNADGSHMTRLTDDLDDPASPAWSPDGTRIAFSATRGGNRDIFVMNADGSGLINVTNHPAYDGEPTWSPDSQQLAFVSTRDGAPSILVINADGTNVTPLLQLTCGPSDPAWSPDGTQMVFVCDNGAYRDILIMQADGTDVRPLIALPTSDSEPAWSPDSTRIAFTALDPLWANEAIYMVNRDGTGLTPLRWFARGAGRAPTWSPDGRSIAFVRDTGRYLDNIFVLPVTGPATELRQLTRSNGGLLDGFFEEYPIAHYYHPAWGSPADVAGAATPVPSALPLPPAPTRDYLRTHSRWETASVNSLAFATPGLLATASGDSVIRLWDARAPYNEPQVPRDRLTDHTASVTAITFAPDGQMLASVAWDQTVRLWDAQAGSLMHILHQPDVDARSAAFAPDGQVVATGWGDGQIRLWNVTDGRLLTTLPGHTPGSAVTGIAFTADGHTLISAALDGTINLWNVADGSLQHTLEGHQDAVQAIAFSPDNGVLASGDSEGMIRLWDVQQQRLLATLNAHASTVTGIHFSPDGRFLVSGGADGEVKLWRVEDGAALDTLHTYADEGKGAVGSVAFGLDGYAIFAGYEGGRVQMWSAMP